MAHARTVQSHAGNDLANLSMKAQKIGGTHYAGDISPEQAYDYVTAHDGILVDVRTPGEWQAGLPELEQGKLLTISWKLAPAYTLNPDFAQTLATAVPNKSTPLFFLCRSGGRSQSAAEAASKNGYSYCFNVAGGFEGHSTDGQPAPSWKTANLPWKRG